MKLLGDTNARNIDTSRIVKSAAMNGMRDPEPQGCSALVTRAAAYGSEELHESGEVQRSGRRPEQEVTGPHGQRCSVKKSVIWTNRVRIDRQRNRRSRTPDFGPGQFLPRALLHGIRHVQSLDAAESESENLARCSKETFVLRWVSCVEPVISVRIVVSSQSFQSGNLTARRFRKFSSPS